MDFGVLGFDNGAPSPSQTQSFLSADPKPKLVGYDLSAPLHQETPLSRSKSLASTEACQLHHMLNFSLPKSEVPFISKDGSVLERSAQNSYFSHYQHTPSMYTRNAGVSGYGAGILNTDMGFFTQSQWNELKHQLLIYKYTSNATVPSNLLVPLKKSFHPYGFTSSSAGSLPYNSLGWGPFHLRYNGKTDPEPGRCRRTDGKKWRCSRDAVADQKYCERHINRGRHRSRKPVEGQTCHAATRNTDIDQIKKQANWIPIAWGRSMGGPLGEALNNTANKVDSCNNNSQLGSSPALLHKAPFGSLSNSSSRSNPIAENKKLHDGATWLCDNVLGSTFVSAASVPTITRG
ncbi:Growth-regulating factor 1 [Hibiscus syriacus]|uniref:Growth-regulating factor n=1 Tax=Hibiscus syriacus TaxID=106335 RepID=A0A6A3AQP7_HIBSY|nr:Growth-regulating factor 1 [Hibiscus syriacus]